MTGLLSTGPTAAGPTGSRRGLLALTATGILWGTIGVAVRLLQNTGMPSAPIAFWRMVCATAVLVPVIGRAGLAVLARDLRRPKRLAAVAVASLTFQLLYIFAVRDVGAGVATLVTLGIGPVLLHTIEAVGARAMPSPRTRLVLVLAVAGLALVATGQQSGDVAPHPLLGLAEASLSGLTCAASASWSRPLAQRMPPLTITLATSAVSVVLLLPVVALTGWSGPRTVPTVSGVLWLGVVTTVVAYGLFYAGLRTTPSSTAMVVTLLEPATAVILAALVLGEPLTGASAAGGALLLTSVAASTWGRSDPVRRPG